MPYLTLNEYLDLGHEVIQLDEFEKLEKRACLTIDVYTRHYYQIHDLESDYELRKAIVKQAVAFQVLYLHESGIMTADDRSTLSSVSIGRTSVSYQNGSVTSQIASKYNLSIDALNLLKSAGFNYLGAEYDR